MNVETKQHRVIQLEYCRAGKSTEGSGVLLLSIPALAVNLGEDPGEPSGRTSTIVSSGSTVAILVSRKGHKKN